VEFRNFNQKLKELGCTIHIETSGAYEMSGILDWITLSPKKTGLPKEEIYKVANELKIICLIITILLLQKNKQPKFLKIVNIYAKRMEQKKRNVS
jgi:organic radical activating enzyme